MSGVWLYWDLLDAIRRLSIEISSPSTSSETKEKKWRTQCSSQTIAVGWTFHSWELLWDGGTIRSLRRKSWVLFPFWGLPFMRVAISRLTEAIANRRSELWSKGSTIWKTYVYSFLDHLMACSIVASTWFEYLLVPHNLDGFQNF